MLSKEQILLLDCWNYFAVELNVNGVIGKVPGYNKYLHKIYKYLLEEELINEYGLVNNFDECLN